MSSPSELDNQIQAAISEPSSQGALRLERLYRQSMERGEQKSFCESVTRTLSAVKRNALVDAWGYRLDLLPVDEASPAGPILQSGAIRLWGLAVSMSILSGLIWSVLCGGKAPVPIPDLAAPQFWLGWAPVTALFIMGFVAISGRALERRQVIGIAALTVVALSFLSAWAAWGRKDATLLLTAFHLPLLAWMTVGSAMTLRVQNRAAQRTSFILKSAEALVVSGIYLAGAGIFGGLTLGIFNVLGLRFPEPWINRCAALALGALPILAIASIYNPRLFPAEQDFSTGPARLMRLLSRLLLTPVLGVLAAYVLWFIPRYFWRPFEERAVLIVYNVSLAAVLLLVILAVPHLREEMTGLGLRLLRHGIRTTCILAFILNVYSLSAIVSRTLHYGISPNRHAILGWNLVTLCFLASIVISQIRADPLTWTERFQASFARFLPLAALWALWALLVSPWIR